MIGRPVCSTPGCFSLARNKGRDSRGRVIFGRHCHCCHRKAAVSSKEAVDNSVCARCGWSEAPVDRHRLDNVVPLCPNCHRLVTMGKVEVLAGERS